MSAFMTSWNIVRLLSLFLLLTGKLNGQSDTIPSNDSFLHLPLFSNVPLSDQLNERIGFDRGTLGRYEFPVTYPPIQPSGRHTHVMFYEQESTLDDMFHLASLEDEHELTRQLHRYYLHIVSMYAHYKTLDESRQKVIKPYLVTVPEARTKLLAYFCMRRQYFETADHFADRIWTVYPDYYAHCPQACGSREGIPISTEQKSNSERYVHPCAYPTLYSPYATRKCVDPTDSHFVHRQNYRCECAPNATWSPQSKVCAQNLPSHEKFCHLEGTIYQGFVETEAPNDGAPGQMDPSLQIGRCFCKPNYYGTRCDQIKNPCIMPIGESLPGNVACNVDKGNRCIPHKSMFRYTCECTNAYDRIPTDDLPKGRLLDNCLREVNPCAIKACVHGACVLSDQGTTLELRGRQNREPFTWMGRAPAVVARCICNAGWTGDKCEHPLVMNGWTPWSPWSHCEPTCQQSLLQNPPSARQEMVPLSETTPRWGMRQRTRYRDCIGQSSDCRQQMLELSADMGLSIEDGESWRQYERRACRPRPCDRHLYLSMGKRAVKRSRIQKQARDTLLQSYTVHLWIVLAFTFIFAIFGFFAAFATKLHSEKVYESYRFHRS